MTICKFCQRSMKDNDGICAFCGYDPKTDAISPTFIQQADSLKSIKQKIKENERAAGTGIDPRIKNFAFIGLVIVAFSIFYKNNFSISGVASEITHSFTRLKTGKFTIGVFTKKKKKDKTAKKVELINMGSFQAPQDIALRKELVIEGISFDPGYRSFVIINGKVISEGQSIDGATVKTINKDSVEVVVDGQRKVLGIKQRIK